VKVKPKYGILKSFRRRRLVGLLHLCSFDEQGRIARF
jgi:hypothetical protein